MSASLALVPGVTPEATRVRKPCRRPGVIPTVTQLRPPDPDADLVSSIVDSLHQSGLAGKVAAALSRTLDVSVTAILDASRPPDAEVQRMAYLTELASS